MWNFPPVAVGVAGFRGSATPEFRIKKIKNNYKMGLKCWIMPINNLNAHLVFEFLGGGTLSSLDPGLKDVSYL